MVLEKALNAFNELTDGESITLPGRKGWMIKLIKTPEGFDLTHFNPVSGDENQLKFFVYTSIGNAYGAGMTKQEPTLGIPANRCGVNNVTGLIVGAIVLDDKGTIKSRYSWSNIVFGKGWNFNIKNDGELLINGESQGYLSGIFLPDKNRLEGYVGVFKPIKPENIKVLEIETLVLKELT